MDDGHPTPTRLLGDRIREERERRSWTQDDLAAATRRTDPGLVTRARVVQRWEAGEAIPQPRALRSLAAVFDLPVAELTSLTRHQPSAKPAVPYGDAPNGQVSEQDVKRRQFLIAAASFLAEGAFGDQLTLDLADTLSVTFATDTATDAASIRGTTRTFRDLDNRLGGGHGLVMVTDYLDRTVQPLLRETHDTTVGRELFSASAELAQLAGWMAYDTQQHDTARRYLERALQYATAAGDLAYCAELLAGMSHQAIHLGQLKEALDLALAAQASAARIQLPALQAESRIMEAHAHARMRDARSCARAIHRAEQVFDRAGSVAEPEWLRYFDAAYLAAKLAHCFRDLGQWHHAEQFAYQALAMNDGLVRAKTFNTALLATAYVTNDRDRACAVGIEAVSLASRLNSGRSVQYIRDLEARLTARYMRDPTVTDFSERVHAAFGAA